MFRKLLGLCLFIMLAFQLQASHVVASYTSFKVDSASNAIHVEFHLYVDSAGILNLPSLSITGFFTQNLPLDTIIPFSGYFGGPFCREGVYYEAIYSKVLYPSNPNSSGLNWITYEICPTVRREFVNLASPPSSLCSSFSFRPYLDSATNFRYYPNFDNRKTKRRIFHEAYGGLENFNDFGHKFPGVDSLSFVLAAIPAASNTLVPYASGFSKNTPLPDFSEDSLNGFNAFAKAQGVLWSTTADTGFIEGNYLVAVRNKYYKKGYNWFKDVFTNVVYYHHRDTSLVPIDLEIETPDSSFSATKATTVLRYTLDVGDTLILDFKAKAAAGNLVYLLSDSILDLNQGQRNFSRYDYDFPRLISRNIGGLYAGLDSNRLRFFFAPKVGNIDQMRERLQFQLVFGSNVCGGDVRSVRIQLDLIQKPKILLDGNSLDSIESCQAKDLKLGILNAPDSIRWEPAAVFLNPRSNIGQVVTKQNGWHYLQNAAGVRLDSIYISFFSNDSIYHIDIDSVNERMVLQDTGKALNREWIISDMVVLNQPLIDTLPIIGAGDYRVVSERDERDCDHYSDTARVSFDHTWSANYGSASPVTLGTPITTSGNSGLTWKCNMRGVAHDMQLKSLYIQGIECFDSTKTTIEVKFNSYYGYSRTHTLSLGKSQYVEVPLPMNFPLSEFLEIEVSIGPSKRVPKLNFSGSSYIVGNFEFYNHKYFRSSSQGYRSVQYALPIGIKYASTVGLPDYDLPQLELYPNPAISSLRVRSSKAIDDSWVLYSLSGTEVLKGEMKGQELNIDVSSLPAGVYLFGLNGQFQKVIIGAP